MLVQTCFAYASYSGFVDCRVKCFTAFLAPSKSPRPRKNGTEMTKIQYDGNKYPIASDVQILNLLPSYWIFVVSVPFLRGRGLLDGAKNAVKNVIRELRNPGHTWNGAEMRRVHSSFLIRGIFIRSFYLFAGPIKRHRARLLP